MRRGSGAGEDVLALMGSTCPVARRRRLAGPGPGGAQGLVLGLGPMAVAAVLALAAPTISGVLILPGRGIGMALATELASTTRVEMREFAFAPGTVRLRRGVVTLHVVNRGRIAHQFDATVLRTGPVAVRTGPAYVEAPGLDRLRLEAGAEARLTLYLPRPGRYPFACTIEGHREAGMTGVLEVR